MDSVSSSFISWWNLVQRIKSPVSICGDYVYIYRFIYIFQYLKRTTHIQRMSWRAFAKTSYPDSSPTFILTPWCSPCSRRCMNAVGVVRFKLIFPDRFSHPNSKFHLLPQLLWSSNGVSCFLIGNSSSGLRFRLFNLKMINRNVNVCSRSFTQRLGSDTRTDSSHLLNSI